MSDTQKILIVEDEPLLLDAIKRKLEKEGYGVTVATDGNEGLVQAFQGHPDLILLDIILPVVDGITVLDRLRKDDWGSKVPVIILTNLSDAEMVNEGREKGVSDYLVKTDWNLNEVVDKVKEKLKVG
ncbi:hypothetical protein A2714_01740 [Candidatus Woesebacteria bacterium RIFCSPHIGHO2_01_FULL_38_9]|uniref:Response regulatory domain-containing protein n=2 Tax=Candidatus Woeseibacteriota TaxID=1752722 RepID=A0A1F7Y174_9BACT|nr:MAG: hypothetical protein A2714_01740 [Candidatus Woesebacteria bacterium RIFCSPHIGHO2_01_FULL_38_9]OGM59368.1 MAG: hypothetical protein A3A75_03385 [Candidatus Woesebacteria bacterium RIFCSPLOWO2_01_FULL_39_10]